jgi:cell division protein FtsI (penicillin-binding protein 3)
MTAPSAKKTTTAVPGAQAQMHDQARARLIMLALVLMMGYLAVSLRLVDLTLFRHFSAPGVVAEKEDVRPLEKALRGSIIDRNGVLLAASLKMASVYADTTMIDSPAEVAKQLAPILTEQDEKALLQKLASGKKFIWIQRNVTPKQEYAINALGNPALGFQEEERRIYPDANLTSHITGYTDVDGNGIAGIEKYFDRQLREAGDAVQLTVDVRVQYLMRRELEKAVEKFHAKAGIGMVMDVNTGEIIALTSLPDFDPNHVGDASDKQKFNRATLGVFEMGSTFKLFSVAAALDSGLVHFADTFDATAPIQIGRFTIDDYHAQRRTLTVPEIFIHSSNIGTAKMAAVLGNDKMQDFYRTLGFMDQAPLELPERGATLYPSPWMDISTLTTSFGHGIAISPLHLMRAAAALVNGGLMPRSTIVKAGQYQPGERIVSTKTSHQLRQLLELTVAKGTGGKAYVEGYDVGGKTGTAEKNLHGRYEHNLLLSSFLGVFPIQSPRYAVLAILDEPQGTKDTSGIATGGFTAAPVVAKVIEQMGPLYGIAPDTARGKEDITREMRGYIRDLKEGKEIAALGTDH